MRRQFVLLTKIALPLQPVQDCQKQQNAPCQRYAPADTSVLVARRRLLQKVVLQNNDSIACRRVPFVGQNADVRLIGLFLRLSKVVRTFLFLLFCEQHQGQKCRCKKRSVANDVRDVEGNARNVDGGKASEKL